MKSTFIYLIFFKVENNPLREANQALLLYNVNTFKTSTFVLYVENMRLSLSPNVESVGRRKLILVEFNNLIFYSLEITFLKYE